MPALAALGRAGRARDRGGRVMRAAILLLLLGPLVLLALLGGLRLLTLT